MSTSWRGLLLCSGLFLLPPLETYVNVQGVGAGVAAEVTLGNGIQPKFLVLLIKSLIVAELLTRLKLHMSVCIRGSSPHEFVPRVCVWCYTPAGISSQLTDSLFPSSQLCPWVLCNAAPSTDTTHGDSTGAKNLYVDKLQVHILSVLDHCTDGVPL